MNTGGDHAGRGRWLDDYQVCEFKLLLGLYVAFADVTKSGVGVLRGRDICEWCCRDGRCVSVLDDWLDLSQLVALFAVNALGERGVFRFVEA